MGISLQQRGVASVELALLLIPLILLTFGTAEFGRAVYEYNTLAKATRDAARFLSAQGPGDPGDITTAQCLVVFGNADCKGSPLLPGLTAAMVSVCDSLTTSPGYPTGYCPQANFQHQQYKPASGGAINLVTVTIHGYQFDFLVPYVTDLLKISQQITFNDISTTMRQIL